MSYEEAQKVREELMHERKFLVEENTKVIFECVSPFLPFYSSSLPRFPSPSVSPLSSALTPRALRRRPFSLCEH
jgi:hypothetical protein